MRGSDLNASTWVLSSQILDGKLRDVVTSQRCLREYLTNKLRWSAVITKTLEPLVRE